MPRGRPPSAHPSPFIIINGQRITWSFIKYVYKRCGCSWDNTIDAFYKAREAKGANGIYRYVMAGFAPGNGRVPYNRLPSADREAGRMEKIRSWWLKFYTPSERRQATVNKANLQVKQMIYDLSSRFSL